MLTTAALLERAKAAAGLTSNAALARLLGVPEKSVYRWAGGKHTPDDPSAVQLAELAGLDPAEVVAAINAERASEPAMRALWEGIAQRLHAAGLGVLAVILSLWISGGPDGAAMAATPGEAATSAHLGQVSNGSIHWRALVSALARILRLIKPGKTLPQARRAGADLAACPC